MPAPQFHHLPQEKQRKIIGVSLQEFAAYGYDLASTNRIVQQAGISKGVLFKYFDDKKSLFVYVCEKVLEDVMSSFTTQEVQDFDDLFEYLQAVTLRKIQFSIEHPLTYRLLMRIIKEPQHHAYSEVMQRVMSVSSRFLEDIATVLPQNVLRPGITWEHVLATITWVAQGLQEKYLLSMPDIADSSLPEFYKPLIEEMNLYFGIIKSGSYKEDGEHD
jgi:TetR/AcrR family transcriptional regulator